MKAQTSKVENAANPNAAELQEKLKAAREALRKAKELERQAAKEFKENVATPFGTTMKLMCERPDIKLDELLATLTERGVDVKEKSTTIRGAYSEFRRVFALLRENGHMKK